MRLSYTQDGFRIENQPVTAIEVDGLEITPQLVEALKQRKARKELERATERAMGIYQEAELAYAAAERLWWNAPNPSVDELL